MKQTLLLTLAFLFMFSFAPVMAGLDIENQEEVSIPALDLDNDGRITRSEVAKYMFFYFDRDGNEVLTKGEFDKERPLIVLPYDAESVPFIDIDNDKQHDEIVYDTASFLSAIMIDDYDPDDGNTIKAYKMMDLYLSRMDTDKSKSVELDEWQKRYQKFANKKPNQAPKAANNDYYAQ